MEGQRTNGNISQLIKLVDQRPNHSDINLDVPQLLQRQVILDDADNVAPDAVNVCVHGQVAVRVRAAAEDVLAIFVLRGQPAEQRPALVGRNRELEPPASFCHERMARLWGEASWGLEGCESSGAKVGVSKCAVVMDDDDGG